MIQINAVQGVHARVYEEGRVRVGFARTIGECRMNIFRKRAPRRRWQARLHGGAWLAAVCLAAATAPIARAETWRTLHNFAGASELNTDGAVPSGSLIMGPDRSLYGVTQVGHPGPGNPDGQGTVFRLTPPAAGRTIWTETILHAFGGPGDGLLPKGTLVMDAGGALYGTTAIGGAGRLFAAGGGLIAAGDGTVFRLSPPSVAGGQWIETILHSFSGHGSVGENADGVAPMDGLVLDASGNLYGETEYGGPASAGGCPGGLGVVFELSPPHGTSGWTETVLHSFASCDTYPISPGGGLTRDANGALYGHADGGFWQGHGRGLVFQLTPPATGGTGWGFHTLYDSASDNHGTQFAPRGPLTLDPFGTIFGTSGAGGKWGTGFIYRLVPPSGADTTWTLDNIYPYQKNLGAYQVGLNGGDGVTLDASGALYGALSQSGTGLAAGTIYKLTPPASSGGDWKASTLLWFHVANGGAPDAPPLIDSHGTLYGTTPFGGRAGYAGYGGGTVYQIVP